MARIRSVHPGLFTDEAFLEASPLARLLMIGIWTECDDQGVFDWKPMTLKVRLLPGNNVEIVELLDELLRLNVIATTEIDGRKVGLVRNFMRFQRPKSPKFNYVIPDEFRNYVNPDSIDSGNAELSTRGNSETRSHRASPISPKRGNRAPDGEEGRGEEWSGGDDGEDARGKPNADIDQDRRQKARDCGRMVVEAIGATHDPGFINAAPSWCDVWIQRGLDPEFDILPVITQVMASKRGGPPGNLKYFEKALTQRVEDKANLALPNVQGGPRNGTHAHHPGRPETPHETLLVGGSRVAARYRAEEGT